MRTIILWIVAIVAVVGGIYISREISDGGPTRAALSHKDATYTISGKEYKLVDGVSEVEVAPGSASKIVTRYFGNDVSYDLDGDGRNDVVFLITQDGGGSGTFFYVVAALSTENGYVGTEAVFLGDRVAPQTIEIGKGGTVIVNYGETPAGDAFAAQSMMIKSEGKSLRLRFDPKTRMFGEVAEDFEGEADPARMTLGMKEWFWVSAELAKGIVTTPRKKDSFSITFEEGGRLSTKTDCNRMSGSYKVNGQNLVFSDVISTKMFCEGSQEMEFGRVLSETKSYEFTSKGELILTLSSGGEARFR